VRISIIWKLLVPTVLVVSVLASGLLWVQLRLLDESFRRRAYEQMAVATEVVKAEQRNLEERALVAAQDLTGDQPLIRALGARDQKTAAASISSVAATTGIPTLAVFDAQGKLFAATWPAQTDPIPLQITSLVSRALAGTSVAGPVPSWRMPGQVAISVIAPVRGTTQVDGVVVVEVLMGNAFVDDVKHLTGLEVGVLLGDLRVASTNFSKDGRRIVNQRTPSRNAHKTLTEGQVTTDMVTAGGRQFISRYLPLRSPGGAIIGMIGVGAPLDQIALDRSGIIRSSIIASLLGLGLACAVTIAIGFRILAPLRRLKNSADAIRRGTPETANFAITTHDEIQDLSVTMAEMVDTLTKAQVALEDANRHKSEFLSRMSHELRTPLNAILGFAQLLEMDSLTPEHRESVEHILKGGRHLLELINEVLDIARVEAGHLAISQEPVPVGEVLQEAVDLVAPMAATRKIQVNQMCEETWHSHVLADRQRLKQVFLNLLSNAVKYNHEGGMITLTCEEAANRRLSVKVTDTGPGIPVDKQARLFTPFERLGAEQTGIEGSGLGLSLSKRLTEAMGGTLGVESTPGQGSTFWVDLAIVESPLDRVEKAGDFVPAPPEIGTSRPARVILYIEDNLSNLKLIQRLLVHRPEISLLPAMQGRLGLQLAREHRPDLILLDVQLPDISGNRVLRQLRETAETRDIPVVVISADATPGQVQRLLAAGASAYLTKPLEVKKFLATLDEALAAA
jgi:signal transduction histidine kinase/CheY-like chemotaxis protein